MHGPSVSLDLKGRNYFLVEAKMKFKKESEMEIDSYFEDENDFK